MTPLPDRVVVRLVTGDGQGIGVEGVTGPRPLAVMRQGPDVSCAAHHPLPRGAVAGRAGPKGAKEQLVMET